MRYYLICLLLLLGLACKKNKDANHQGQEPLTPLVTSYNVVETATSQYGLYISGKNFGSNKEAVVVTLDSLSVTVSIVNDSALVVQIPAGLITSSKTLYQLVVSVSGRKSNPITADISIGFHGWRYVGSVASMLMGSSMVRSMAFSDMNRGVITGRGLFSMTLNGGIYYSGPFSDGSTLGYAISVYDEDNIWLEANRYDIAYRNQHDPIFYYFNSAHLDTITTVPGFKGKCITGLYMIKPFRGYILNQEGRIYKVNGSFSPGAISLEYQSSNYAPASDVNDIRFYNISALDSNNMVVCGWPGVAPNKKHILIQKKAGVYTEYDLTSKLSHNIYHIQITDPSTVYFSDGFYGLFKLNNGTQFTTLPIAATAFCFADSNTGYACGSDSKIYKTIDGGQNWSVVFVLRYGETLTAMHIKDQRVWGIGNSGGSIRYDP